MTKQKRWQQNGPVLCLVITFLCVACGAPRHYAGEKLPDEQLATITLQTKQLEIQKIDGEEAKRPSPTKNFLVGGGYVGMARALGTVRTQILPGKHQVLIAYRLNNCIQGGTGLVTFTAEAGHGYEVGCVIGPSKGNYTTTSIVDNQEIVTKFTDAFVHDIALFVTDITDEGKPARMGEVTSEIVLRY